MVTPMTQKYFGFGELGNSVMYGLCGVEVIGGFFLVRWLSRVLEERVLLAAGLLVSCVACVWCLVFLADPKGMHVCVCVGYKVRVLCWPNARTDWHTPACGQPQYAGTV